MMEKSSRSERNWVFMCAAAIMLLTTLPYIFGLFLTPKGYHFLGLTHNIDDGAVYLSWMRQAADGHFFIRNLFTNDPQSAKAFNILFLVMGNFARVTHLPLIIVFHLFRIVFGFGLILAIWKFSKLFLYESKQRIVLMVLVGFSSGIGWLVSPGQLPRSVDLWQPEAITFLSIYLNPLFLFSQILMLGTFYYLILTERNGRVRDAVTAGAYLLILGNVHTYDILTIACIWVAYVVSHAIVMKKFPTRTIALSILAALIAIPSTGYQFYLYSVDAVYRARANSGAPSPEFWFLLSGYGLILAGAIAGVVLWSAGGRCRGRLSFFFPTVWALVGFLVPFIPIAQQRKLVMGLHIPLCILCAYAVGRLLSSKAASKYKYILIVLILLTVISNVRFVATDVNMLLDGITVPGYQTYMSKQEWGAMHFLERRAKWNDSVLAPPTFALFTPAFTGVQVCYGHWSETPDYAHKVRFFHLMENNLIPLNICEQFIQESKADYVVMIDNKHSYKLEKIGLRPVYRRGQVIVFRVNNGAYDE
ncbi:hypothetical protein LLG46_14545 [bacterium]|nr:hypothetical protein [bacterium]